MSEPTHRVRPTHRLLACMVVLLSSPVPSLLAETPRTAVSDNTAFTLPDLVAAHLEQRIAKRYHVGIVVGLLDENGSHVHGFGQVAASDARTPDSKTLFEIGSISKVFTAITLADLATRGALGLDDPIDAYLPEGIAPRFEGTSITLDQLAAHTARLPRLPSDFTSPDPADPYAAYGTEALYASLRGVELLGRPGEDYLYSNLGAGLLGELLAQHQKSTWDELVRKHVTGVLGLDDTVQTPSPEQAARESSGHMGRTVVPHWTFQALAGAGALRSTADDMLRFLAANLGLIDTPILPVLRKTHNPRHRIGPNDQVALGWHRMERDGTTILWHNGGTGGFRTFIGFDPDRKRGVVVLANSNWSADPVGFHLLAPSVPLPKL